MGDGQRRWVINAFGKQNLPRLVLLVHSFAKSASLPTRRIIGHSFFYGIQYAKLSRPRPFPGFWAAIHVRYFSSPCVAHSDADHG